MFLIFILLCLLISPFVWGWMFCTMPLLFWEYCMKKPALAIKRIAAESGTHKDSMNGFDMLCDDWIETGKDIGGWFKKNVFRVS